jgi:Mn2+/Fe2+ NRAMP family transporter
LSIIAIQVITNTINIGADLSAMAQSAQLLWHISYGALLAITTVLTTALIVLLPYRHYATYLKILGLSLLTYIATAFTVHVDWATALRETFIPHLRLDKSFVLMLVAVLGVTISPYEFFWQSNEEVEELVEEHKIEREEAQRPQTTTKDVRKVRFDTIFGMFFSNVITYFIIVVAAVTLHAHGHTNVDTATQAAAILRPLAGPYASFLFAIGIISAGLLAIPVMAGSSAYAMGGAFGWRRTLSAPFWKEPRFYGTIAASLAIGLVVNATHIPPFKLLFYSGVLNGVASPPLLFILTQISSNPKIMGPFVNSWFSALLGWSLCGFTSAALIAFVLLSRS